MENPMRLLFAAALTLVLSACSTMGLNSPSASGSLDPLQDDVGSLLIAFDLPRGLGPNNAAGQLFTFDVPQGGPTEHLRLLLVPADADLAAGHLPPPAEGRAYYLYTLDGAARAQIQAAQATANARAVPGKSVQIGVVPHLCSAGPVDQYATTVSIFATLPGRTGPLPFMNHETLANVLQMPGSTQLAICNG
jgi:hypothetical protein